MELKIPDITSEFFSLSIFYIIADTINGSAGSAKSFNWIYKMRKTTESIKKLSYIRFWK